jgi:phosphohistidine swiveling domain-containing protein
MNKAIPTEGSTQNALILSLNSPSATLANSGGKGAALARLVREGRNVPAGFIVTTRAYRAFVAEADLHTTIESALADLDPSAQDHPSQLEAASTTIRAAFEQAALSPEIESTITEGYSNLPAGSASNSPAVAVRSSATAEDLPDQSFAGQQESYLNVSGADALLDATRLCFSSLWTARAIGYRTKMGIGQNDISMAVVVQVMVPAEVSGVLFTANPSTGARDEIVINASYGLGEAIVSGEVTPDEVVLARDGLAIKEMKLGAKERMIVSEAGQGVRNQEVDAHAREAQALSDLRLRELAALGLEIETSSGAVPQDIEWALAFDQLWVLQSRPITQLPAPPLPDIWEPPMPGSRWIRRQVVEHMPDPLSPLFEELYLHEGLDHSMDIMFQYMGKSIALGYDQIIDMPIMATVNGYAYMRADIKLDGLKGLWIVLKIYLTALPHLLRTWLPHWRDEILPAYRDTIARWKDVDASALSDAELLEGIRAIATADADYWYAASMPIGIAKVTDGMLDRFLSSKALIRKLERSHDREVGEAGATNPLTARLTSGHFLRGFPSKTLDAQTELVRMSERIHGNEALRELVHETKATQLVHVLEATETPEAEALLEDLRGYLDRYGHLVYSLDFAVPTQAEDPLPVVAGLKAMSEGEARSVEDLKASFVREREREAERLLGVLGPLRRPIFRKLLAWAQRYTPHREEAMFHVGWGWPTLRSLALELGRRLTEVGTLDESQQVFFLERAELESASQARGTGEAREDLRVLARERVALRDAQMRLHPPGTVPVGYRYKLGPIDMTMFETQKLNTDEREDQLDGFAVSPGRVTAPASVIMSPADFEKMRPGSILVCPTTTPAWTPLFGQAAGLVTDIGGILAHGSIVAREYGIPAVMGTGNATKRVVDGQMITIDGARGVVELGGLVSSDQSNT